jgi:surface antigen/uncharacterized protein YukE
MSLISLDLNQACQTASAFDHSSNDIENLRAHLQQQWSTLSANWQGYSKHEIEAEVRVLLDQGGQVAQLTRERGVKVTQIADRFQDADENLALPVASMAWQGFDAQGASVVLAGSAVLGAATVVAGEPRVVLTAGTVAAADAMPAGLNEAVAMFQQKNWNDKFAAQDTLVAEINKLTEQTQQATPLTELEQQMKDLDSQIADLKTKRDEADRWAKDVLNNILPDTPITGEEGRLYRTRADDFEDQVAEYDRQIIALSKTRDNVGQQYEMLQTNLTRLENLQMQQDALQSVIKEGIPPDGPTPAGKTVGRGGLKPEHGCTYYVAGKRNVYAFGEDAKQVAHPGNAYQWNEQAQVAGYEVGNIPVKGAIMVYEPGVRGVNVPNGHVAYVEEVTWDAAKQEYQVKITDNSRPDKPVQIKPIPVNGASGISFIYDKPPAPKAAQA